ncbi:MAG TPA: DUF4430 domain-containing protein [Candidatus Saccharimonadales bacterium]|nr:DUF4430 domain-containing protein [Candidatus Saccharimonadales bacterium]
MGRTVPSKLKTLIVALAIVIVGAGGAAIAVVSNSPQHKVGTTLNSQQQLTDIKYNGQSGVDALTLLKKHAQVQAKHYSFGDLVTSINGSKGTGPKYWTFYANGKESMVGASVYVTKNSDKLEWKLQ